MADGQGRRASAFPELQASTRLPFGKAGEASAHFLQYGEQKSFFVRTIPEPLLYLFNNKR